jgi:hypothetical protein
MPDRMSSEPGRQGGRKKVINQEAFVKIATMEEMGMYHKLTLRKGKPL